MQRAAARRGVQSTLRRQGRTGAVGELRYAGRFGVRIFLTRLQTRFYIGPATGLPHIYDHHVDEDELMEVLKKPSEDRAGRDGSGIALGQTTSGRYLRVIYVPDLEQDSVFVITAYELEGKPLTAFRRRRRKKQQ